MSIWLFVTAAAALSVERIFYVFVARSPQAFRLLCRHPVVSALGTPLEVVESAFYIFKGIQLSVFAAWCLTYSNGSWQLCGDGLALAVGCALMVCGQVLNLSVFYRLGRVGAFYGDRLGHSVPLCRDFPFSLMDHPQYFGVVLSIWGFFLVIRFPNHDWYVLPLLESFYYLVGCFAEGATLAGTVGRFGKRGPALS